MDVGGFFVFYRRFFEDFFFFDAFFEDFFADLRAFFFVAMEVVRYWLLLTTYALDKRADALVHADCIFIMSQFSTHSIDVMRKRGITFLLEHDDFAFNDDTSFFMNHF